MKVARISSRLGRHHEKNWFLAQAKWPESKHTLKTSIFDVLRVGPGSSPGQSNQISLTGGGRSLRLRAIVKKKIRSFRDRPENQSVIVKTLVTHPTRGVRQGVKECSSPHCRPHCRSLPTYPTTPICPMCLSLLEEQMFLRLASTTFLAGCWYWAIWNNHKPCPFWAHLNYSPQYCIVFDQCGMMFRQKNR